MQTIWHYTLNGIRFDSADKPTCEGASDVREYYLMPADELTDDDSAKVKDKIIDNLRSELKELENDASCLRQQIELMRVGSKGKDEQIEALEKQLRGLVELLSEWPVGYRGEGGWEPIGCT